MSTPHADIPASDSAPAAAPAATPQPRTAWQPSGEAVRELQRLAAALVSERAAPGAAWGVFTRRDGLVASGGAGASAIGGAVPHSSTVFRVASLSKSFTAAAILILAESGALHLDDAATSWVPELATTRRYSPDSPPIAIVHLLSHTSGLPKDDPWADRLEAATPEELGRIVEAGLRTVHAPGTAYEYSNLAYALLGAIVERASGVGFRDFVQARLLDPLGLGRTTYDYTRVPAGLRATGYHNRAGRWVPEAFTGPGAFSPIGGLLSTVEDLAVWAGWLADAFPPGDDADDAVASVLSRASRRRMQTSVIDIPPVIREGSARGRLTVAERSTIASYALGLVIDHDPEWGNIVHHSGGYPGFGTCMRWHGDSGIGVVVLANGRGARASVVGERMQRVVLEDAGAAGVTVRLWPQTEEARTAITDALIRGEDPFDLPIYAENVAMDSSWAERREDLAAALDRVGPAGGGGGGVGAGGTEVGRAARRGRGSGVVTAESEAHVVWLVPAARGALRCEIRMTPEATPRVQTLTIRANPALSTDDLRLTSRRVAVVLPSARGETPQ